MIERVEQLMRHVAAEVIVPRFQRLDASEIHEKGPSDVVTVADREAEERLTAELAALLPGSRVVGEEAVAANPTLLETVSHPGAVWLVDPLDGTANFAQGIGPFAVMVALLRAGQTTAGWILDPLSGDVAVAERGSGAYLNGVRTRASDQVPAAHALRGSTLVRRMPPEHPLAAMRAGAGEDTGEPGGPPVWRPGRGCAGYEYPSILRDETQFTFFWQTMPWDHAPGVLLVEESGGVAGWLDTTPYTPTRRDQGLLVARNPGVWRTVRDELLTVADAG